MRNQTVSTPQSDGLRLMQLMDKRMAEILRKERGNSKRICLYGTGEYWTAFEQSAYQLCRLVPDTENFIARSRNYPFSVVAASISEEQLQTYLRDHIFSRDEVDYKELPATLLIPKLYSDWHQKEVEEFMNSIH